MDLDRAARGELIERLLGQGRGAVLDGAAHPVLAPRDLREPAERLQVEVDLGDRAVRQDHTAVAGPGLHADLADPRQVRPQPAQRRQEAGHKRFQILRRAVLAADLADLAADRDGDPGRLALTDVGGHLGGVAVVQLLALRLGRPVEVDQGGGVDVDVVEAGGERVVDQPAQALQLRLRVLLVLLGVDLLVVALDEDRAAVALAQRGGDHHRGELLGLLVGVAHLRAGDLEDEVLGVAADRGADDRPRHVVGHAAHVDRRRGGVVVLVAPGRHVEVVDRGRVDADCLGRGPDQPARRLLHLGRAEDRAVGQQIECLALERRLVPHLDRVAAQGDDPVERPQEFPDTDTCFRHLALPAPRSTVRAARRPTRPPPATAPATIIPRLCGGRGRTSPPAPPLRGEGGKPCLATGVRPDAGSAPPKVGGPGGGLSAGGRRRGRRRWRRGRSGRPRRPRPRRRS